MKILTVIGTRPEIIRLSLIISLLDKVCDHVLVHTGQNYDHSLSTIFFNDLIVRKPNYFLNINNSNFAHQLSAMLSAFYDVLIQEKPDKVLILGDTNSGLCAIICERLQIPVYHMEAGNRCFDNEVPEEINRKLIDSISSFNMPYTQWSKQNLLKEGHSLNKIFVTGNPINEVIQFHKHFIGRNDVFKKFELLPRKYFLATFHRSENVDNQARLQIIIDSLSKISDIYKCPIVCSIHPRTKNKLEQFNITNTNGKLIFTEPLGFFDFLLLEQYAKCILTDSGTVIEEACIFKVPSVVMRNAMERPELLDCGSCMLAGIDVQNIIASTSLMLRNDLSWKIPDGYLDVNVSQKVVQYLIGKA